MSKIVASRKSHMMPTKLAETIVAGNPDLGVSAKQFQEVCETLFQYVVDSTKKNNKVSFPNFLKFERVKRAQRTFQNPNKESGGAAIVKPERYALVVSVMGSTKKEFEEIEVVEGDEVVEEPVKKPKKGKKGEPVESESEAVVTDDEPPVKEGAKKPAKGKKKAAAVAVEPESEAEAVVTDEEPPVEEEAKKPAKGKKKAAAAEATAEEVQSQSEAKKTDDEVEPKKGKKKGKKI